MRRTMIVGEEVIREALVILFETVIISSVFEGTVDQDMQKNNFASCFIII
jgi:hypothetical protein